jgi:hypothetical protein
MPTLEPVDFNPFAPAAPSGSDNADVGGPLKLTVRPQGVPEPDAIPRSRLVPVDFNPFAAPGEPSVAGDVLKSAGVGVVKGGINLAGLLGDVREATYSGAGAAQEWLARRFGLSDEEAVAAGQELVSALRGTPNRFPTTAEARSGVESATGPLYEPQTRPGRYAQTVGEFAPAAVMGPGGVARNLATLAVVPGVASEAAGEATKGTPAEPWARTGAALVTGLGASVLARPGTAARALERQLPEGMTDAHVAQAQSLISDAAQRGVQLTWPEALSQVAGRPVLTDMQRVLESAPQSRPVMQEFMGGRPQQMRDAAQSELAAIGSPPGPSFAPQPPANPSSIGPAVGRAASDTIRDVRGAINDAAEPFYSRSSGLTLTPQEMARVRALPGYPEAAATVRKDPQLARYVRGLPEDSVGFLNEVKKQLDQQARNLGRPLAPDRNMQRAAGFGSDAAAVRQAAGNASPDYAAALAVESVARERYLQPLLDGPLGRIAKKDVTTQKAIDALFPAQPLAGSERETSTAVSALAKRNPWAARQLVRAHLEQKLEEAFTAAGRGQEAAGFAGASFANRVAGSPVVGSQRLENLRAAIEGLPGGEQIWPGFNRFLEIAQATGTRQPIGSKTAFNTQELSSMSTGTLVGNATKTGLSPGRWMRVVNDAWSQWQLGRNLDQLARIVTDPKSARLFGQLARAPAGSTQAQAIFYRLVAGSLASAAEHRRDAAHHP